MKIKRMQVFLLVLVAAWAAFAGIALAADVPSSAMHVFLPFIFHPAPPPPELLDVWVAEQTGIRSDTYSPGETVVYYLSGQNLANDARDVSYRWEQAPDCGETLVYTGTLSLPAGNWTHSLSGVAPNCLGSVTNSVMIDYLGYTSTLTTHSEIVNTSSQIILSEAQGFEKCGLPSLEQMEIWKGESPYDVFNIYLGGEHFACNLLIDADWARATALQGWDFILTWAGHGTSCWEAGKENEHPISSDPAEAYQEGRVAAEEAVAAARSLSFLGSKVIYYDVEGYSDVDPTCRPAMEAFLEGWAARLHESGDKAGAYGSPCRSYIMDWADNDPALDDIWFARWNLVAEYDEFATVWDDPDSSCPLPDSVWANQQRLRQYAGDHNESWPEECSEDECTTINGITSNVLYGEITRFLPGE